MIEIAYTKSGFVRVVQFAGNFHEVQVKTISGAKLVWKKLYGVYSKDRAIKLMESYCF